MWILTPPTERFLTTDERAIVAAMFDALLPADPSRSLPGAADADTVEFVDRLLAMADETYYELPIWRLAYRNTLPALDEAARAAFAGRGVAGLTAAERTKLLQDLEAGRLAVWKSTVDQKTFFKMLRDHCIQGSYADPRWGGNRDRIMWDAYGYISPPRRTP